MNTNHRQLRKHALILECFTILIAAAVLYLGTKRPELVGVLVVGALLAVVTLVMGLSCSFKARKIEKEEYKKLLEANEKRQAEMDAEAANAEPNKEKTEKEKEE